MKRLIPLLLSGVIAIQTFAQHDHDGDRMSCSKAKFFLEYYKSSFYWIRPNKVKRIQNHIWLFRCGEYHVFNIQPNYGKIRSGASNTMV